jgi:hypothetical protein
MPSPSGPSRRGPVRSGRRAIALRQREYEQRLVRRILIAACLALLQALFGVDVEALQ